MSTQPSATTRRWAARAAAVLTSAAVVAGMTAGTASADHPEYTMVPGHTYTLGEFNGIQCTGQLTTSVRTPHDRPGAALVSLSWFSYFSTPCSVVAQVNWHNLDTNQRGTSATRVTTTGRGPLPPPITTGNVVDVVTGPGRVVVTITTESLHFVAAPPVEVRVPA